LTTSGLTLAPTWVTTSHLLITLHKGVSKDATMLEANFHSCLSTSKRITSLASNNLFAGFYMITPDKRVCPIFQSQCCMST
jgi:hypothetical protein